MKWFTCMSLASLIENLATYIDGIHFVCQFLNVSVSQLLEYKCQSAVHLSVLHPMIKMLRVLIVVCWSPSLVKKRMVEGTLPAKNFRLPTPPTVELKVSVRVISVIDQCGLTQQDQTSRRSHFKYHAITQFRHFWSFWCINSLTFRGRLLWRSKLHHHGERLHRMVYLFYILSRQFYLAKGDTAVDMTRNIETLCRG